MKVVPFSEELVGPVQELIGKIPESDINSFAEDVTAPGAVEGWLRDPRGRRAVAVAALAQPGVPVLPPAAAQLTRCREPGVGVGQGDQLARAFVVQSQLGAGLALDHPRHPRQSPDDVRDAAPIPAWASVIVSALSSM